MNEENEVDQVQNIEDIEDNSDGTQTIIIDSEQYDTITSDLQSISDSLGLIRQDLNTIKNNQNSIITSEGVTEVPEDYYTYISDIQGQQVFFQSLICGLLIGFAFFFGLKDRNS